MKTRKFLVDSGFHLLLAVLSFIWLLPIAFAILTSFRGELGGPKTYIFPREFTFSNYTGLFTSSTLHYGQWFANTLVVAIFTCLLSTFFVLSVAYTMSRLRFTMRRPLLNVALILGMFPGFMAMIAVYYILKGFGLLETGQLKLFALVLVYSGGAGLGFNVTKGFFDTIPKALDEAAFLDGCTKWQTFYKITLPLSRPVITYTVLTAFIGPWVDFIVASVIMKDNYDNYTIALGLFRMIERENVSEWYTAFTAGAVLVSIPIAILFLIMQKNYVEGITGGSVKG